MRQTSLLFCGITALVTGCSAAPDGTSQGSTAIAVSPEQTSTIEAELALSTNGKGTVLGVVNLSGHLLTFVEFVPGLTGMLERGHVGELPKLSRLPANATLTSLWASLTSARVPASLPQADARAQARRASEEKAAARGIGAPTVLARSGPHNETEGEQNWFNQTFCPGAEQCFLGNIWANTGGINRSPYTATAYQGSEGTTNLTMHLYHYVCGDQFCFFPGFFEVFWQGVVVPGNWLSVHVTNNQPGNTYGDINCDGTNCSSAPANPTVGIEDN